MQIFLDSFDHYADADKVQKYTQLQAGFGGGAAGTLTIAAVGARGTNGLKFLNVDANPGNSTPMLRCIPDAPAPSGSTVIFGFRLRSVTAFSILGAGTNSEAAGTCCLLAIRSSNATLFWIRLNTTGTLSILRGSTVLGTTSVALVQNVYQYVEVKVVLHDSTGTVELRLGGSSTPALALTGQDTTETGATTWDEFRFGPVGLSSSFPELHIDDFYLLDGSGGVADDFAGDLRIDVRYMTADGNSADGTPSAGSDLYAMVDESQANGDTDYNELATIGDRDTFVAEDAVVAGAPIAGIQVVAQAKKVDAGSAGHKAVTRIGSTDYAGSEVTVGTTYAFARQNWPVKPSDSTAWTDTDFNAAEFGYEKSA